MLLHPVCVFSLYFSSIVTLLVNDPGLCPPSQRQPCFGSLTCTPPPTSTSCWTGRTWRWESWWRRMMSCRSARPKTADCSSSSPRTTVCRSWLASSPQSRPLTWRRGAALSESSQWWLTQMMMKLNRTLLITYLNDQTSGFFKCLFLEMHARWQLTICGHSVFSEFQSVFCRHVSQNVTETWRFDGDSWKLHVFHACDFYYHFFPKSQSKTFAHLWINRCQTGKRTATHCSLHLQSEKDLIILKWCRYNDDELSLFQGHIEELNDFISKCHLKFQDETNESVFGKIYLKLEVLCTHDSVIGWFISKVLLQWWRPNCCRLQQDSFMWRSTK